LDRSRSGLGKSGHMSLHMEQQTRILQELSDIASGREMVGCAIYGAEVCGYAGPDTDVDVLLILKDYLPGVKYHFKKLDGKYAAILVVDKGLFEKDVEKALLGEFVAARILARYIPLVNPVYLGHHEVSLKKRIVGESLESLALEYTHLLDEILISPEFFLFDKVNRILKVYPFFKYHYLNAFREDLKARNLEATMPGFRSALNELAADGLVSLQDGFVRTKESFIAKTTRKRLLPAEIGKNLERSAVSYVVAGLSRSINPLMVLRETLRMVDRELSLLDLEKQELDDPKSFLFLPVKHGVVKLSDETTIGGFVQSIPMFKAATDIKVSRLSAVFNTVYLIELTVAGEKHRVVAKKFEEWINAKWINLALWAFGTQNFVVLGRRRLANECAMNRAMNRLGFHVPEIYHVSWERRMLFEEYVQGTPLERTVKTLATETLNDRDLELIRRAGGLVAKIHQKEYVLGDCKPENMILDPDDRLFVIDLEQAGKRGNKIWDVAEFVYYGCRYGVHRVGIRAVTRSFIQGYLQEGSRDVVVAASRPQYARVFAPFVPAHLLMETAKELAGAKP